MAGAKSGMMHQCNKSWHESHTVVSHAKEAASTTPLLAVFHRLQLANRSRVNAEPALFRFRLAIQQSSDRLFQLLGQDRLFQIRIAADRERLLYLRVAGVG
jgi:hypothetical protein